MEKRERITRYILGGAIILAGTGFVFYPKGMLGLSFRLIGLGLIVAAVASALLYYAGNRMQKDFIRLLLGLAGGGIGLSLLKNPGWAVILTDLLIGILVMLLGAYLIYHVTKNAGVHDAKWRITILCGVGIAVLGFMIVMLPDVFLQYLLRILGVLMVYGGIDGIRSTLRQNDALDN